MNIFNIAKDITREHAATVTALRQLIISTMLEPSNADATAWSVADLLTGRILDKFTVEEKHG